MFCPQQREAAPAQPAPKGAADQQKISARPDQRPGCGNDRAAQADQAGIGTTAVPTPPPTGLGLTADRETTNPRRSPCHTSGPGGTRPLAGAQAGRPRRHVVSVQAASVRPLELARRLPASPPPDGWTKTFTDPRLCVAIVDRLTCNGAIIETG